MRHTTAAIVTIVLLGLAASAPAAIIELGANLDGAQANGGAGTGSAGTGTISITLDDQTNQISWSGSFSGLTTAFTVAHFHGPALPNQSAGVTVGTAVTVDPGGLSGTSAGNAGLSAQQVADLLGGLWYWNIHSTTNPGGELRGNISIVPEPGTGLLLCLGIAGLALRDRRR